MVVACVVMDVSPYYGVSLCYIVCPWFGGSPCYGVSPCDGLARVMSPFRGSHGMRLSNRRVQKEKSRGPKGLYLKVQAQMAPKLP